MNTEQINRFDELMREKLSSYEAEPDMDLLQVVHARKNRFLTFRNLQKLIILLSLLGVGILGGYLMFNSTSAQKNKRLENKTGTQLSAVTKTSGHNVVNAMRKTCSSSGVCQTKNNNEMQAELAGASNQIDNEKDVIAGGTNKSKNFISELPVRKQIASNFFTIDTDVLSQQPIVNEQQAPVLVTNSNNQVVEACNAKFTYYTNYDGSIQFTPITTEQDNNAKFSWNFGDGSESHKNNPKHNYSKPGAYAVVLTVTNKRNGCKVDYAQLVRIDETAIRSTTNISGTVFANAEFANHLQIDLLEYNYQSNDFEWAQSTFTNNKGYYEFSEVVAGNYMILTSGFKNYLPTYYGNNTDKNYATTLSVFADDYTDLKGYDIQLTGNPLADNTRTNTIDTSKTILLVFDENNNPIASIEVSKNGSTNGGNLPDGNYKLVNPATGQSAGDLEIGNGSSKIKTPDGSGSGGTGSRGSGVECQLSLMPNPAVNSVTVGLSHAENAVIEITIINNQGAIIKRQTIPAGSQSESIDVSGLSPGNYYVIAKQNGITTTKTLVKSIDNSK